MLFPFLHHFGAARFDELPFELQMKIARFVPNLPHLTQCQKELVHYHYSKRFCPLCGHTLPFTHKKSFCLCHRKRKRYSSTERQYKIYRRPMVVMNNGSITPFTLLVSHTLTESICFVGSNQPEYLYSLKKVLKPSDLVDRFSFHGEKLYKKMILYIVNTHTCLRTFLDICTNDQTSFSNGIHVIQAFGHVTTQNRGVLTEYRKNDALMERFFLEFM